MERKKVNTYLSIIAVIVIVMTLSSTCNSQSFLGLIRNSASVGVLIDANSAEVDAFIGAGFTHKGVLDFNLLIGQDFSINEKVVGVQVAALIYPSKVINIIGNAYAQYDSAPRYRMGVTFNHNFTHEDRAFSPFAGAAFRRNGRNDTNEIVADVGMGFKRGRWLLEARYNKDLTFKINYLIFELK